MSENSSLITRPLCFDDYGKGYLKLLSQLTVVGDISETDFSERLAEISKRSSDYHIIVVEDVKEKKVIATGTLLVERKFIRNCGSVGHIEDIVVDSSRRGQHLGTLIISELKKIAQENGCYKVILDCSEENASFYEKCGFKKKEIQMAHYFI